MHKRLLLIFRQPPFSNNRNRETVDIALACAAFDIPVSLIFLSDAVLQLVKHQAAEVIEQKSLLKTLSALQMYDVDDYYILESDLKRYQLSPGELTLPCKILSAQQFAHLVRQFETVINL